MYILPFLLMFTPIFFYLYLFYIYIFFLSAHTAATMTDLEKSLECMMLTFQHYGSEHGDKKYLNKSQLKKLLEEQLPSFVKVRILTAQSYLGH